MKMLLAAVLVLGLTACSENKGKDKGGIGGDDGVKKENVTDYGVCGNYSPRTIEGSWMMQQRAGEFGFTMVLDIYNGYVTVSNICDLQGRRLVASVSGAASYNGSILEIFSEGHDEQTIDEPGFNMNCNVSMSRSRMNYRFKGSCLELSQPGSAEKFVLIPR